MIVDPTDDGIARAARNLRAGELVAFPTETVYGLGADARSAAAVHRVFAAKGRPASNPLIVHVDGAAMARQVASSWPDSAQRLATRFWPGPLTMVLDVAPGLPSEVTAGGSTVAIRVPDHPVALALLAALGGPLVAPSANRSGAVSPTTAEHVAQDFPDVMVLDGGPCREGIESTVLDLTGEGDEGDEGGEGGQAPRILRPGVIGAEQLAAVLGVAVAGPAPEAGKGPVRSPGLSASHYAPRAPVRIVGPEEGPLPPGAVRAAMPTTAAQYAARLYAALREADAENPTEIWIEGPTVDQLAGADSALWRAIMDRLHRAASPRP